MSRLWSKMSTSHFSRAMGVYRQYCTLLLLVILPIVAPSGARLPVLPRRNHVDTQRPFVNTDQRGHVKWISRPYKAAARRTIMMAGPS